MAYINLSTDIDVEDFLEACNASELRDVAEWLTSEGGIDNPDFSDEYVKFTKSNGIADDIWNESVSRLLQNRMRLTVEEEQLILDISKKFL